MPCSSVFNGSAITLVRQGERSAELSAPQSHPRGSSYSGELNIPIRSVTESQRRERPLPPPLPLSRSESQLPKDNDYTCSPGYTENVTSQRSWREIYASEKTSSRPWLPRYQPRSGSETFSPLEAPKLQQETVYSSPGPFRSGNTRAPPQPQSEAPSYSYSIPQRPSNFQGQPAQQEQFHEVRRQGQPIPPQLVSAAAGSRPLLQELNFCTPHGTRPPTPEQAQQITIEGIRPSRERDLNRNSYLRPEFPPDLRDGDQSRNRPPLQEVARGQEQAGLSKSSISGAYSSDLGGLDSR
ncbi:hypothetical protein BOTNAR_0018g00370 [Botryotinia narcissicola]|uniref:Uncharacterized protein n=1 Tax=Botryotinia narcissicola TaxID=278944 RepID=A0A4Z1J6S4_9HELO|nr:hypothetical protein BOTNAR_0018g00370 [Botryotinia narcissicola]